MIGKTEVAMNEPTNVAPFRLTSAVAEKRIHEIAKSTAAVALTLHAKERMAEREITSTDIYRILRTGVVETDPAQNERGEWKCKMTLALRGRRTAGVVVVVRWPPAKVTVLTVEWEDGR